MQKGNIVISSPKSFDIDKDVMINSGDYWVHKESGLVRLIRSLKVIDGELHSLKVLPHPSENKSENNLTVSDFLCKYSPIDQEEAVAKRREEIEGIHKEIDSLSRDLAIGYVDNDGVSANKQLSNISNQTKSDMSLPIAMAKSDDVERVKQKVEDIKALAEKQSQFIKKNTSEIANKTNEVSRFYTEKAEQSLASIEGTLSFVSKLQEGIHTLDLFLGEGVEVIPLVLGEDADSNEPITFYQRKLFLDEEFFYDLANGGVSCSSLEDFKKSLVNDFSIIERMLPTPKSVVLMQYRRYHKERGFISSISEAIAAMEEDKAGQEMFLLVRNGRSVYFVFSEDVQHGERLFPTARELEGVFKNESGLFSGIEIDRQINYHDIENAHARDVFDKKSLYYKRLLILLNGIHYKNPAIFGKLKDESYDDWMSLAFQKGNFNFVHDDEEVLGVDFVPVSDFMREHNSKIQKGSRVIGLWDKLMNEDSASGIFSKGHRTESYKNWNPIETLEPQLVEMKDNALCCYIECRHEYYHDKKKRFKCLVDTKRAQDFLVVDNIKSEMIDFYLESRAARVDYAVYASLMIGARDMLREEEQEHKPYVKFLQKHIQNLYPAMASGYIHEKLFESLVFWRRKNKGVLIPDIRKKENEKYLKQVSDIFYAKTDGGKLTVVEAYIEEEGIEPLSIFTDNSIKYFIYAEVPKEERVEFGSYETYPFVYKYTLQAQKKGMKLIKKEQVFYGEKRLNEEELKSYRTLILDDGDENISYKYIKDLENIKRNVSHGRELFSRLLSDDTFDMQSFLLSLYHDREIKQKNDKGNHVLNYCVIIPCGAVMKERLTNQYYYQKKELVLLAQKSSLDALIMRYGDSAIKEANIEWTRKTYQKSEERIEKLLMMSEGQDSIFTLSEKECYFYNAHISVTSSPLHYFTSSTCIVDGVNVRKESAFSSVEEWLENKSKSEDEQKFFYSRIY